MFRNHELAADRRIRLHGPELSAQDRIISAQVGSGSVSSQDSDPTEPLPDDVTPNPVVPTGDPSSAPEAAPDGATPAPEALALIAERVVVRRAPRFGAFVRTGVLIGAVIGLLVAATPRSAPEANRTAAVIISVLAVALLGALLGAAFAVIADRLSRRH